MHAAHSEHRPTAAGALAVVLFLEAAALVAVAVWLTIVAVGEGGRSLGATVFLAVLAVGAAFFLLQAGRGVLDGRAWSRAATIVWQVLQMGVSFGTYNGAEGPVPLALTMLVPAIVGLVLVFSRPVRTWLAQERTA